MKGLRFSCKKNTRNVLDEDQLAEMVLAPEGWQVDKSTIPTGYMMHIMSVGNGVKAGIQRWMEKAFGKHGGWLIQVAVHRVWRLK